MSETAAQYASVPSRRRAVQRPACRAKTRGCMLCCDLFAGFEPMPMDRWDHLLIDCRLATLADTGQPYGAIEGGALGWKDGVITFAGAKAQLPDRPEALAVQVESVSNAWITP